MKVQPNPTQALGYAQGTGLTAAKTLADCTGAAIPAGAEFCLLQAETQNIRWTDDGTVPTAALGMLLIAGGDPWLYDGHDLTALQFFQVAATAKLNVAYYKNAK